MSGKIFNVEKVLYFADQEKRLHVSSDEAKRYSDLNEIVEKLVGYGEIYKCGEDDSGSYYATTTKGKIKLLGLQIEWRERNGKDASGHRKILEGLKQEQRQAS